MFSVKQKECKIFFRTSDEKMMLKFFFLNNKEESKWIVYIKGI